MKKNFMLIAALAMVLFFAAPITSQASEDVEKKGNWKSDATGWWYEFEDGTYYKNEFAEIEGLTYYFDETGYMATGWERVGYSWYYFYPSGNMLTGWGEIKGTWYYFELGTEYYHGGEMYCGGARMVDEKLYLFAHDGALISTPGWNAYYENAWNNDPTRWYYIENGLVATDKWINSDGKWYYVQEYTGVMVKNGKYDIADKDDNYTEYVFDVNGAWIVTSGWHMSGGNWYYYNANMECATGWHVINGEWYFFEPDKDSDNYGVMYANGRRNVKWNGAEQEYYFERTGAMVDGWYNRDDKFSTFGEWVFCYPSGALAHKWVEIAGKWYYFESGEMQVDRWIKDEKNPDVKYYLGHDGAMVQGWYHFVEKHPHDTYDYGWIYTDPVTGAAYTGWLEDKGKWYSIVDGWMQRSGVCYTEKSPEYPDQWYYMGEDGKFSVEENLAYQAAVDVYNKTYYEKYDKRMNSRYVFGDDGAMVTGWYAYKSTYGTTWCYADATGKAYDGWLEYAGKWYHIENGYMQTNQYVDGCWIGADGVWVK